MRSAKNDLQNTNQSQDNTGEQGPFETPGRSHSTAICRGGVAKHKKHSVNKEEKKSPGTFGYCRACEPTFLRNGICVNRENVLRKSEHSKHVIHVAVPMPRMTCKTQINRKTILENKHLSRHLDAAIPPRSAETKLQNTIAQRQQRRGKVTWNNAQSHCACKSSRIRRQSDDALDVQLV